MAAFVIHLHEVEAKGSKRYAFDIAEQWLGDELSDTEFRPGSAPGHLRVDARKTGPDLLLQLTLAAQVKAACSRCNEPTEVKIDHEFTHLLSPRDGAQPLPEELELSPEDLDRDYYSGDRVELDALVREQILLEVPMQPVCAEGCKDEVVVAMLDPERHSPDPRLMPLMELKKKLAES